MTELDDLLRRALEEDRGPEDITTAALIPPEAQGTARILAKQELVVAGLFLAERVLRTLDPTATVKAMHSDGDRIPRGAVVATAAGSLQALLTAERTLLNFLSHLSGIATLTRRYVDALQGSRVTLVDTRKTLPGLRTLEKYAVRVGGGANHRLGLFDGVLIKDNHVAACGGMREAVRRARQSPVIFFGHKIEVEAKTLLEVEEALTAGADIIMLDNMPRGEMREAVRRINRRALVEISGGITLETIREVAALGVDFISVGSLTHSAPAADLSMKIP